MADEPPVKPFRKGDQSALERAVELSGVQVAELRHRELAKQEYRMNTILDARHAAVYGAVFARLSIDDNNHSRGDRFIKLIHDKAMEIANKAREESKKHFEAFSDAAKEGSI